jgi:4-oxalocrotonate tautomerase
VLFVESYLFLCFKSVHDLHALNGDLFITIDQEENKMPYVNIRITREGATAEQKAILIKGVTRLLQETLGKNPATTVVTIDEVETDNWGIGGESVTVLRKKST